MNIRKSLKFKFIVAFSVTIIVVLTMFGTSMYTFGVLITRFEDYAISLSDLNEFRYQFGNFEETFSKYLQEGSDKDLKSCQEINENLNTLCEKIHNEYSNSNNELEASLVNAIYSQYPTYIQQVQSLIEMEDKSKALTEYQLGHNNTGQYISKNIEKLISYRYQVSGQSLEDTNTKVSIFRVINIVTFIVLGVIIYILFTMTFKNIIEPIQKLARQSQQIANYNFDVENIKVTTQDEMASLIHMFNHMREKLKLMFESNIKNLQMAEELLVQVQDNNNENIQKFVERQRNLNEEIFREANIDHLTNLMNKNAFLHCVDESIKSKDLNEPCAVFVLDIDNFVSISNTLGNGADELLKYTAVEMNKIFKDMGFVAKWERDIFTGFVCGISNEDTIHKICNQLNTDLNINFRHKKKYHPVSVSIGVCIDNNPYNCEDMYKIAYQEMQTVKTSGKNGHKINYVPTRKTLI